MNVTNRAIRIILWSIIGITFLIIGIITKFGTVMSSDQFANSYKSNGSSSNISLQGGGLTLNSEEQLLLYLSLGILISLGVIGLIIYYSRKKLLV